MASAQDTMHTVLNRSVPVPDDNVGSPYLDIQSGYIIQNRLLRIVIACCSVALVGLGASVWKLATREPERLVVRVDEKGTAVVAPYASLAYQPREPEVRHFLMRFVQDHYGRVRATYRDAFQRKLFFLDASHARAAMEEEQRAKTIQTFLQSGDDELEVYVTNVTVEDMRQAPYKASVDFDKVFRSVSDGREQQREKHTAHFVFTLLDKVPNSFVATNPLGLVITYFREDQGF